MEALSPLADRVLWHDLECGGYAADLPLWRRLARAAEGPVLDVGAGTGRVALDLAGAGHEVLALDRDPELLAALADRARERALPVRTVCADARDFALRERFGLILAPMQTVQLLGGPDGRAAFLRRAAAHLRPGGLLAAAIVAELDALAPTAGGPELLPLPDVVERDGWVYASQPLAVRADGEGFLIERRRDAVAPDGARESAADRVVLDPVTVAGLEAEGTAAGLRPGPACAIAETPEHVGSEVVLLRA